jgi:uncharacterized membrane protein YhaH (DUF805 family)
MGALRGWSQNIMNFSGRASRSAFWWFWLAGFIADVVLQAIVRSAGSLTLSYLVSLAVFVVTLSVAVRRLHDSDKSGWLVLLAIIPVLGWIALLVLYCLPGTPGPNRHG